MVALSEDGVLQAWGNVLLISFFSFIGIQNLLSIWSVPEEVLVCLKTSL